RPPDFRGWAGMVVGGPLAVGDAVAVLPGGARTTITAIHTFDGPLERAEAGQSVTVCLADALDVGRGDLLAPVDQAPAVRHDLSAILCWMSERPLRPGDRLDVRLATRTVPALVDRFEARFDLDALAEVPPPAEFPLNALGRIHLRLAEPLAPDAYRDQPDTGGLVLIDPHTHDTVGAALVLP
ncbi:MAG: sulfate adenylyltransferase, partial [Myxococcales bacterium]|nr:sulfate adenylyltransferase [Myxococcales bacterium]